MSNACRYLPPANPAVRWLADVGSHLTDDVQERLRTLFFGSNRSMVIGTLNSVAVALVACWRLGDPIFAAIAGVDALLLAVRYAAWKRMDAPTDLVFIGGLCWSALQSAVVSLVILSGDAILSVVVLASALASVSGIVGRNFVAPRYAMTQMAMVNLSINVSVSIADPAFTPLAVAQAVMYALMNLDLIGRQRRTTIQAISAEIDSRAQSLADPLTGLLNRRGLEAAFEAKAAAGGAGTGLLYLDLDGFKQVNDRLGHGAGDGLLKQVAERLSAVAGPGACVCRLGGDEFLVLTPAADGAALRALGGRIVAAVAAPYHIEETVLARVEASVGAVLGGSGAPGLARMMALADQALYAAKAADKGRCILHAAGAGGDFEDEGESPAAGRAAAS